MTIKDNENNKYLFFDSIISGKRYQAMARYGKTSKDNALEQINNKKQEIIDNLTVYFR